jgi:hypothetical protein
MKRNSTDIDFGFECEFFAVNKQDKKVYNASYLISKIFDICTDIYNKGADTKLIQKASSRLFGYYLSPRNPVLLSNPCHDLIADGTVFEIVGKQSYQYWYVGAGTFKDYDCINRNYNKDIDFYRSYVEKMFNVSTLLTPYISQEDGWEFVNPGWQFSGEKVTINAYTGKGLVDSKKDSNKNVSFRTAGFHIHIRFREKEDEDKMFKGYAVKEVYGGWEITSPTLCNELIKELDSAYSLYISYLSNEDRDKEILRASKYATLGNYRIKDHKGYSRGYKTLEYRQFSSVFFKLTPGQQESIMAKFNEIIIEFLNKI